MGPVVVNRSVHTASKQHQRKNIPIGVRIASRVPVWIRPKVKISLWLQKMPKVFARRCKTPLNGDRSRCSQSGQTQPQQSSIFRWIVLPFKLVCRFAQAKVFATGESMLKCSLTISTELNQTGLCWQYQSMIAQISAMILSSRLLVLLQFYGYLSQQQNMMQDYVRTSTYQRAMLDNNTDFQDKVRHIVWTPVRFLFLCRERNFHCCHQRIVTHFIALLPCAKHIHTLSLVVFNVNCGTSSCAHEICVRVVLVVCQFVIVIDGICRLYWMSALGPESSPSSPSRLVPNGFMQLKLRRWLFTARWGTRAYSFGHLCCEFSVFT